ncbi:cytidylyltransferase domain-containing protein [Flavobacterium sp.]|uniref:acylneuraminate cytidylyltransferase family protein n=1 Tax=Flavobacterium sp. TaxID=239 RepID=UPI003D0AEA70
MSNKTIAIIPARGGSKRLPGKNIKLLGEIPLLAHSINYAKQYSFIEEVYVTTNDDTIAKTAIDFGAKVIIRPEAISGDLEPTVSALKHVIQNVEGVNNVVLLQPTNPLRPNNLLDEAFAIFEERNCDSLFTVSQNHQKFGKIIDSKYIPFNYKVGQRSQDLEPLYFENGLLYISKAELILNDIIISEIAYPMIVNHPFASIDIDTIEDFEFAEYLYNKLITHNS